MTKSVPQILVHLFGLSVYSKSKDALFDGETYTIDEKLEIYVSGIRIRSHLNIKLIAFTNMQ